MDDGWTDGWMDDALMRALMDGRMERDWMTDEGTEELVSSPLFSNIFVVCLFFSPPLSGRF